MRKKLVAGNWKMNKIRAEAAALADGLKKEVGRLQDPGIVLCPPYTALEEVSKIIHESRIMLGAQNIHWENSGAFTGEVSAAMLKDAGCRFVILGHSERRQYFHETNEDINKKTRAALRASLTPIVCIGENLKEREEGTTFAVVESHVLGGLLGLLPGDIAGLVIAYEPVWAIGTGKTATPQQAQEVHRFIRGLIEKTWGRETAQRIIILYGGSVKPDNTKDLIAQKDIDGFLVGGASLDVKSFTEIIKNSAPMEKAAC